METKSERVKRMLFGYPGSKWRMSKHYVPLFPAHSIYVSAFGGSASEFAHKAPSRREIFNDVDANVHAVFAVLRDDTLSEKLIQLIENTTDSRCLYDECYTTLRDSSISLLERAFAFLIIGNVGFMGKHPMVVRYYACSLKKKARRLVRLPDYLCQWRDRMRLVEVENVDAFDLLDRYDAPDTFFFLDPPYHQTTCHKDLFLHEIFDHRRFLKRIQNLKGKAMICSYPHGLYEVQLYGWRKISFPILKSFNGRSPRTEVIWMNYDADGQRITQNFNLIKAFEQLPA